MPTFNELHPRGEGGRFTTKPAPAPTPAMSPVRGATPAPSQTPSLKDVLSQLAPKPVTVADITHHSDKAVSLPPGIYVIGDPGYMVDGEREWMDWLNQSGAMTRVERNDECYVAQGPNGNVLVGFPTGYGDGLYPVHRDGEYLKPAPVDAGLLGIAPLAMFPDGKLPKWVQTVEFTNPVRCEVNTSDNGHVVQFGDVSIVTIQPGERCAECDSLLDDDEYCAHCDYESCHCSTCGSFVANGPTDACSGCEPDTFSDSDY